MVLMIVLSMLAADPPAVARGPEPITSVGEAISNEPYPKEARAAGVSGLVRGELDVDAAGVTTGCRILRSSGSAALDATTCRLVRAKLRFRPAVSEAGKPVASVYPLNVRWHTGAPPVR